MKLTRLGIKKTSVALLVLPLGLSACGKSQKQESVRAIFDGRTTSNEVRTFKGHTTTIAHSGVVSNPSAASEVSALGLNGLKRLTKPQYTASVTDAFGFNVADMVSPFMRDPSDLGFPVASGVSPDIAQTLVTVAESIAEAAVGKPKYSTCAAPKARETCLREILDDTGLVLFRRPLTEAERVAVLRVATTGGDWTADVRTLLAALLQSPHFLYVVEPVADGRSRPLQPFEWLTRAALLTTGRTPKSAQFDAIKKETEATFTKDKRERIVSEMLASPEGHAEVDELFNTWLELEQVRVVSKPSEPSFTVQVAGDLAQQSVLFAREIFWSQASDLRTLFTSSRAFVNARTATLHGVQGVTGDAHRAVDMPSGVRAGVLTLPAVLAAHSNFSGHVNPIYLGKFIRRNLLCQSLPAIVLPADALQKFAANAGLSFRDRFRGHSSDPACATCHRKMDEMAFAFEDYSDLGAYKPAVAPSKAKGLLVDVDDKDRDFTGPVELGRLLADSKETQQCYLRQLFRRGYGRMENDGDRAFLEAQWSAFAAGGFNMRQAYIEFVAGEAFLTRTVASDAAGREAIP